MCALYGTNNLYSIEINGFFLWIRCVRKEKAEIDDKRRGGRLKDELNANSFAAVNALLQKNSSFTVSTRCQQMAAHFLFGVGRATILSILYEQLVWERGFFIRLCFIFLFECAHTLLNLFDWDVFPHPKYSPDLVPLGYHLFPQFKKSVGRREFMIMPVFKTQWLKFFKNWTERRVILVGSG